MNHVFLLINQDHLLLEKSGNWGYGNDLRAVYRTPHRDEALNQKVELTVKSPELRVQIIDATLDERGFPVLSEELLDKIPPRPQQTEEPETAQEHAETGTREAANESAEDSNTTTQAQIG